MRVMVHAVGHRPAKRVFLYLNVALSGGFSNTPHRNLEKTIHSRFGKSFMLLPPLNTPFCDWLTVTYRTERPDLAYISLTSRVCSLKVYMPQFIRLVVLILAGLPLAIPEWLLQVRGPGSRRSRSLSSLSLPDSLIRAITLFSRFPGWAFSYCVQSLNCSVN